MLPSSLRYFLAVAQGGSIRAAGEKLRIAESAVSRQVAKLEDHFGAPLFVRTARGMVLSSAGEILLNHAREAALQSSRLDADMASLRGLQRGHVAIRTVESFAVARLPEIVARFTERHPGITMDITICGTDLVLPAVRDGACHLGIAFNQTHDADVEVLAEAPQPLMVLCAPDHRFAGAEGLRLADLLDCPLALPAQHGGSRRLIDAACHAARITLRPALETNAVALLAAFIGARQGVALFSASRAAHQIGAGQLVAVPMREPRLRRARIALLARRGRRLPPAGEAFAAALAASLAAPPARQPAGRVTRLRSPAVPRAR